MSEVEAEEGVVGIEVGAGDLGEAGLGRAAGGGGGGSIGDAGGGAVTSDEG